MNRILWNPSTKWIFFDPTGLVISCGRLKMGIFLCQLRHECESSLKWKLSNSKWWTLQWLYNFAPLLALIAILIACVVLIWRQQLAISKDRRLNLILIMKSLSSRRRSEPCQSRFLVRLTRTSAWWDNVEAGLAIVLDKATTTFRNVAKSHRRLCLYMLTN